jgi:DNA-directed RNA polymerase subunit RPC12/RpoP
VAEAVEVVEEVEEEPEPPPFLLVSCAACGKKLTVKSVFAGKKGKCPQCGKPVQVPAIKKKADGP